MSYIDLTKIPTLELLEIRNILKYGAKAYASKYADADGGKRLKALADENEQLKKVNARRDVLEAAGLEWDEDYWMSFDDGAFNYFLNLFIEQRVKVEKELALSERTRSIKVPVLIAERELNAIDACRQGFAELKNRGNGHNDQGKRDSYGFVP